MLVPDQKLSDGPKQGLFIGAFVASGVGALCDIAKTELTGYLQRRRDAKKTTVKND